MLGHDGSFVDRSAASAVGLDRRYPRVPRVTPAELGGDNVYAPGDEAFSPFPGALGNVARVRQVAEALPPEVFAG